MGTQYHEEEARCGSGWNFDFDRAARPLVRTSGSRYPYGHTVLCSIWTVTFGRRGKPRSNPLSPPSSIDLRLIGLSSLLHTLYHLSVYNRTRESLIHPFDPAPWVGPACLLKLGPVHVHRQTRSVTSATIPARILLDTQRLKHVEQPGLC